MTVETTQNEVTHFAAGTSGETFTIPFRFLEDADIKAFLEDAVPELQTLNTNYTLSGVGNVSGGTATWVGTPTAGKKVRFLRLVEPKQKTDYSATGAFPAETHERALDKATMLLQQRIARDADAPDKWDAEGDIIGTLKDGVASDDAVSKGQLDAQTFISSGSISAPDDPGDNLKGLRANAGAVTYEDVLVPIPVAADLLRGLIATAAGTFAFHGLPRRNLLINGGFRVSQRGTTFDATTTPKNDDDTYLLDRWILLSDGNDRVDVSQESSVVPTGSHNAIKLDVETVSAAPNAEKAGILTILEARDSIPLRGQVVSVSFRHETTTGAIIKNLRAALVAWTGTADSPTSDLVDVWGASGTDPTTVADWGALNAINTPANIPVNVDSDALHKIEGLTVPTNVNNLALFIWIDDTDHVAGDVVYISDIQLELGDIAHDFQRRPFAEELALCQRYAFVPTASAAADPFGSGFATTTTLGRVVVPFPQEMRAVPSLAFTAATNFRLLHEAVVTTLTALSGIASKNASRVTGTVASGLTVGNGCILEALNTSAQITFDAEL